MTNYLRPDEMASLSEIERAKKRNSMMKNAGNLALAAGGAAVGGASGILPKIGSKIGQKILPFLSEFIPEDLAIKGINKIAPQVGSLLKKGQKMGLDIEGGLDYLKKQITNKEESAKEERNIIEQYSPELHQFIDQRIKGGEQPLQAAAAATTQKQFGDVIKKMMKDHKTPWANIIESVYGNGQTAQSQQQQPQEMQQEMQQAQQPGAGSQKLMQMLQTINQRLGQQ